MNEWIVQHSICGKIAHDFFYKTRLLCVCEYISIQTNINSKHDEDEFIFKARAGVSIFTVI